MVNTTFDSIWRDISPFAVGFDRTFGTLELLANARTKEANYPPYNIRKVTDDQYTIELAVAGFEEKDIDVELSGENLITSIKQVTLATEVLQRLLKAADVVWACHARFRQSIELRFPEGCGAGMRG